MMTENPLGDPEIGALLLALEQRPPRLHEAGPLTKEASVALILRRAPEDLEILLIQRPVSDSDPWSGHMALPGGRRQADEEALTTAVRETLEEVGIDLAADGVLLGRLDSLQPMRSGPRIAVAPFVFAVQPTVAATPDPREVAKLLWVPVSHLADPASAAEHLEVMEGGGHLRFPALSYDGHIIWGLTHRMLQQFLEIIRSIRHGGAA